MSKVFYYKHNPVRIKVSCYQSPPNLYVGLICEGGAYDGEPFTCASANFDFAMPPYCTAIKNYSENAGMLPFLIDNGFGTLTGQEIESRYVTLPIFRFDRKKLRELDPDGCDLYEKTYVHQIARVSEN